MVCMLWPIRRIMLLLTHGILWPMQFMHGRPCSSCMVAHALPHAGPHAVPQASPMHSCMQASVQCPTQAPCSAPCGRAWSVMLMRSHTVPSSGGSGHSLEGHTAVAEASPTSNPPQQRGRVLLSENRETLTAARQRTPGRF